MVQKIDYKKIKINKDVKTKLLKNKDIKTYFTIIHPTAQFIHDLIEVVVFLHF